MKQEAYFSAFELSSNLCKKINQCFVCDRSFKTASNLMVHQKTRHCEVIVFEIMKNNKRVCKYSNLWRVTNFDDLFVSKKAKIEKNRSKSNDNITCDLSQRDIEVGQKL